MLIHVCSRECINRVCEAAGLKTVDKKRKVSSYNFKVVLGDIGRILTDLYSLQ